MQRRSDPGSGAKVAGVALTRLNGVDTKSQANRRIQQEKPRDHALKAHQIERK